MSDDVETVRARLLAKCTEHYGEVSRRGGSDGRLIRTGLLAAERAIQEEPAGASALVWIERVLAAMDRVRIEVEDPFDDDGWTVGGVRWVENLVRAEAEVLRKQSSRIDPTVALLRLATAARRAFPDRAEELLASVDLWFHGAGEPSCSLCGRTLDRPFAATRSGSPEFARFHHPEPGLDVMLCEQCTTLSGPEAAPTEKILVDLLRAVRDEAREGSDELCAELERRFSERVFRGVETGICATCGDSTLAAKGRILVCFACIAKASTGLQGLLGPSPDSDLPAAAYAEILRDALASVRSTRLVGEHIVLDSTIAYDIDRLLSAATLSPEPRDALFSAIGALAAAIVGGLRVFGRPRPPFDDRSEDFARLDRFRHPELAAHAQRLLTEPLLVAGPSPAARRHTALLLYAIGADDYDALWPVADGPESSPLAGIPGGSTVFVGDLFSLAEPELGALAEAITDARWRVIVGVEDLPAFAARCAQSPHAALQALARATPVTLA